MSFRNGDIRNGKVAGSSVTWREEFVCQITRRSSHGFAGITRIKRTGKRIRADRCDPWLLWLYLSNLAFMVILAFRTLETGQPLLAFSAAFWKAASSPLGIRPTTSRCTAVMAHPESSLSRLSVAVVLMLS